jgi:AraC-like DNA-binding protein
MHEGLSSLSPAPALGARHGLTPATHAGALGTGPVAWLDVSSRSAADWPVSIRTGPLGLQIMPLPGARDSFFFRGGRIRGLRCVFTAATVNGAELRRSARVQPDAADNTTQVLIRMSAGGSVLDDEAHFRGARMRVISAGREVSEEFSTNSHICTLNVQQAALGIPPETLAALTDHLFVVSPAQSAMLRSAIGLLSESDPLELGRNLQAVDRYLASLAALLLRTAVPTHRDEPERLGTVRSRTEAIIHARAADPELTPAILAAQLQVSLRQLYRAFDGTESPAARIRHRRLELAAELLVGSGSMPPVEAVAQKCGFASAEYFSRAFRREFGLSPRAYRSANRDSIVSSR